MSATTLGHQGVLAVERKEYETAIVQLDKALESSTSPSWLLARATAHQQLKHYDAALRDAELAYHVAAERGSGNSRKQMIDAQYRRSVIYFRLGRYADSDCCARWSMRLAEGCPVGEDDGIQDKVDERGNYTVTYEDGVADCKGQPGQTSRDSTGEKVYGLLGSGSGSEGTPKTGFEKEWKRAYSWRSMALGSLGRLPEDDPGRKVSVTKVPPRPQAKTDKKPDPEPTVEDDELEGKPTEPEGPAPGSVPDEKLKLRADFYQSAQNVTISLFVKDAKKENLDVKFSRNQVQISPLARAAAPYVKPGDREATSTFILDGEIDPSKSRWSATPRKIELVLQKAAPGVKWGTWGREEIGALPSTDSNNAKLATTTPAPAQAASASSAPVTRAPATAGASPAYPTSSRSGPKNWDKLGEEEAGDDEDKSDVNSFFKQLYKGATPDQQRAMMKSFIESNGTALSTDWEDVKNRKVETVPPEGVEVKKWE
ncbi:ed6e8214-a200-4e78-8b87-779a29ec1eac [Thermothielavioides terrestris]|uniref:Ed6e8214-a200-4e78-8b87-779a29ec1eac n=1 Tax=Thermothielavioides terrestris TaxID=2587410 RepID=A0A3S4ARW2_9PEZI|nr:ed6e8214-a200-4e78-8b87-779a29ec1eac [Thermothielavioides terrestris]